MPEDHTRSTTVNAGGSGSRSQTSPADKPRPLINCAECRRLKLKCDRQVPCSACVRRGCRELCPDGVKQPRRSVVDVRATEQLNKRLAQLENLLSDHGVPLPTSSSINEEDEGDDESPISPRHKRQRRYPPESPRYNEQRHGQSESQSPFAEASTRPGTALSATRDIPHPQTYPHLGPSPDRSFWDRHSDYPQPPPFNHRTSSDHPQVERETQVEHSHGTLVIGSSGRSRYLGPTAGTEWLKNQEVGETDTPHSRSPRDTHRALPDSTINEEPDPQFSFPFASPPDASTMEGLLSHLPPKDDAAILVDCYYRYYAWLHDVAPRSSFQPLFDKLYSDPLTTSIHLQQLALIYMILAVGTLHNLELPPNDESADEYLALAKGCLMKGDFLNNNTIAGVRALITMGHYLLETEKGRNGDSAWPLWGLAMRIVVAMGLHRDGAKWNLPDEVVEERRQVFWECHTIEVFQANCFSRPSSLIPKYIDTAFPTAGSEGPGGTKTFSALTFELCQISARILDVGMTVHHNPYSAVQDLYSQLCSFERQVPFHLRCRVALMSLPSVYADPDQAKRESPDVSRKHLHQTFHQYTIALNISEQILHLQRPYFVMAMHDQPIDPTRSIYGHSYLAVVERCGVLVQVVASLYELFPAITSRHWFFWYHLFTAAVCLGTLILKNPSSVLSNFALSQIDQAILSFSQLIKQQNKNSPSMIENHDWLVRLRHRAIKKINHYQSINMNQGAGANGGGGSLGGSVNGEGENDGEDVELLGWRTRLIERASTGIQKAINIPQSQSKPAMLSPNTISSIPPQINQAQTLQQQVLQQHLVPFADSSISLPNAGMAVQLGHDGTQSGQLGLDSSTDQLLHQFWDPMIMPDATRLASENWWSWDLGLNDTFNGRTT